MPVLHDHPFTRDNATEMAKLATEARRIKRLARLSVQNERSQPLDQRAREVLRLLREQIEETRKDLLDRTSCYCDTCKRGGIDGKTRAQLLGALDRLLERERVWSQRPGPANLKPEPRRQQHRPWAEPQEAGPVLLPKPEPAPMPTQGAEPQKPGA